MSKKDSTSVNEKFSYFTFIHYPSGDDDGFLSDLIRSHCMFAVSPLHSADDENAKPHYHIIYKHPAPVRISGAQSCIPAGIAANDHIEPAYNPRNLQRYLIHLDNPDKEQFEGGINEIQVVNGFPLNLKRELSADEKAEIRRNCFEFITDNGIDEYSKFLDGLMMLGLVDEFEYAFNHTIAFNAYLKSKKHSGGMH